MFKKKGFRELAFATPLKDAAAELLGIPAAWLKNAHSWEKEQIIPGFNFSYREFLQKLGTEFARDRISPDFWVDRMNIEILKYPVFENMVISDVRFDNEADFITKSKGMLIEVVRDSQGNADDHASELGLSKQFTPYTLLNDGKIDELPDKIHQLLYNLKGK